MFTKTTLDNGVRIISERVAGVRTVALGVWIEAGSRDEHDLNSGVSHCLEHMLFKGTHRRTAADIAREFDMLGGTGNAFTSREHTCCHATVRDADLPQLVDLLADLVCHSTFDAREFAHEQGVILQEIAMAEDDPADLVHDLFAGLLWAGHPLGRPVLGNRETVAAMDRHRLLDHRRRCYRPDRLLISAAGNVDHRQLVELCRPRFECLEAGPESPPVRTPPTAVDPARRIYSRELEQVHVVLGVRTGGAADPDRFTLLLLNIILGGNMSSRLFQRIREERGLAYSVYSYLDTFEDCGQLAVYLGVDPATLGESLELIGAEIADLARRPVSEAELDRALRYAMADLYLAAENMEARMGRNARNEFTFGRFIPHDEVAAHLARVRPADIQRLAAAVFAGPVSGAVLGPVVAPEVEWGAL